VNYLRLTTYRAGLLQARAYRNLSNFMSIALSPYDIVLMEWALLGVLKEAGEMRPSAISDELGVKNPLTSRHLKRLAEFGYIERNEMDDDARGAMVHLTPIGKELVETIEHKLRGEMRDYLKGISLRQLASYLSVLEKLAVKNP
jgi:MarR family transcriptional regulator for hemolysin